MLCPSVRAQQEAQKEEVMIDNRYKLVANMRDNNTFITYGTKEETARTLEFIYDCMAAGIPARVRSSDDNTQTVLNPQHIIRVWMEKV